MNSNWSTRDRKFHWSTKDCKVSLVNRKLIVTKSIPLVGISLRTTQIIWESIRWRVGFTLQAFHLSIPFTSLSLSTFYPFHLSIPFTPLSFSLSLISPSLSISLLLPFFLSLSPSLCLLSLSFSLGYLMNVRPCSYYMFIQNRYY